MDSETPKQPAKKEINKTPVFFSLAYRYRTPQGRVVIRPRWGLLGGLFAGGAVFAYILGATALFFFFKYYRNFEDVKYFDMYTLPFQMDDHRQKYGTYQIEKALELVEAGEHRDAFFLLRTGVRRAPGHLEGRKLLGEYLYFGHNRPDNAIGLMREGLAYAHEDLEYIRTYYTMLMEQQEDMQLLEDAQTYLEDERVPENIKQVIAVFAIRVNLFRGNFDAAEDLLTQYDLSEGLDGIILQGEIDWARGLHQKAIADLEAATDEYPNVEILLQRLYEYYRQDGQYAKARFYAVKRSTINSLEPRPKVDLLYILDDTGEEQRADRTFSFLKQRFADYENDLILLAAYAADRGKMNKSRELYDIALEEDYNLAPFALGLIQSHINAGDYAGAEQFAVELSRESPAWLNDQKSMLDSLRAIAVRGMGQNKLAEAYLRQFLDNTRTRIGYLLEVAEKFEELGALDLARQVYEVAYFNNQRNQPALTGLITMDLKTGNSEGLGERLKKLLEMRRPSPDLLREAYRKLGSDQFIFTRDREEILIKLDAMLRASPSTTTAGSA